VGTVWAHHQTNLRFINRLKCRTRSPVWRAPAETQGIKGFQPMWETETGESAFSSLKKREDFSGVKTMVPEGGSRTPTRVTPRQILSLSQIHSICDEKLIFINQFQDFSPIQISER